MVFQYSHSSAHTPDEESEELNNSLTKQLSEIRQLVLRNSDLPNKTAWITSRKWPGLTALLFGRAECVNVVGVLITKQDTLKFRNTDTFKIINKSWPETS